MQATETMTSTRQTEPFFRLHCPVRIIISATSDYQTVWRRVDPIPLAGSLDAGLVRLHFPGFPEITAHVFRSAPGYMASSPATRPGGCVREGNFRRISVQ